MTRSVSPPRSLPLLLCALLTTACGTGGVVGGSTPDTAYVGVAVGLTNTERYVDLFKGVEIALDELNAARPEGKPVLVMRRAPASASSAVEIATGFRDDPDVVGVVGHTETDATMSAGPIYADVAGGGDRALVAVSPTAAGTRVTRGNEWIFRVCPVMQRQAELIAGFVADSLPSATLALVYRNDEFGKDFLRFFRAEYARRTRRALTETDPFTEDLESFEAYGKRAARRNIQAVVIAGNGGDAVKVMRDFSAAGAAPTYVGFNPIAPELMARPEVSALVRQSPFVSINLFLPDRPVGEEGRRFAAEYQKRYGAPAQHWAALGYDAARVIGLATHQHGKDRHAIRRWIAEVGRSSPAISGATGEIRFDAEGDPIDKAAIFARQKG